MSDESVDLSMHVRTWKLVLKHLSLVDHGKKTVMLRNQHNAKCSFENRFQFYPAVHLREVFVE